MTSIELTNPSPYFPFRGASQIRARNVIDKAPTVAAPAPQRATRAGLEQLSTEI